MKKRKEREGKKVRRNLFSVSIGIKQRITRLMEDCFVSPVTHPQQPLSLAIHQIQRSNHNKQQASSEFEVHFRFVRSVSSKPAKKQKSKKTENMQADEAPTFKVVNTQWHNLFSPFSPLFAFFFWKNSPLIKFSKKTKK
jgi:hypothetical protein